MPKTIQTPATLAERFLAVRLGAPIITPEELDGFPADNDASLNITVSDPVAQASGGGGGGSSGWPSLLILFVISAVRLIGRNRFHFYLNTQKTG